jgi:hypothetical protein
MLSELEADEVDEVFEAEEPEDDPPLSESVYVYVYTPETEVEPLLILEVRGAKGKTLGNLEKDFRGKKEKPEDPETFVFFFFSHRVRSSRGALL